MTVTKVGEAETHLSELLARVEAGEEIVIARDDAPMPSSRASRSRMFLLRSLLRRAPRGLGRSP
jgi:antitoxin (DNA-binding transcriptional repressor) of toxin-antitoxin stability system